MTFAQAAPDPLVTIALAVIAALAAVFGGPTVLGWYRRRVDVAKVGSDIEQTRATTWAQIDAVVERKVDERIAQEREQWQATNAALSAALTAAHGREAAWRAREEALHAEIIELRREVAELRAEVSVLRAGHEGVVDGGGSTP